MLTPEWKAHLAKFNREGDIADSIKVDLRGRMHLAPLELVPEGRAALLVNSYFVGEVIIVLYHGGGSDDMGTNYWWEWDFLPDGRVQSEHHREHAKHITPLDLIGVHAAYQWYKNEVETGE